MIRPVRFLGLWFVLGAVSLGLSGCSIKTPTTGDVLTRASSALSHLSSFSYRADLNLSGFLPSNFASKVTTAHFQVAGISVNGPQDTAKLTLDGRLDAESSDGPLSVAGNIISLPDYAYFRITDLKLPSLAQTSIGADSLWYKIKQGAKAEADSKRLGVASAPEGIASEQVIATKDFLEGKELFIVSQVFEDTTLFGIRVYHYEVQLNPEVLPEVASFLTQLLRQPKPTEQELAEWTKYKLELWIDKRSYNLVQLKVKDVYVTKGLPTSFDLQLILDHHNRPAKINPPKSPEELNPNNLWPLS